MPRRKARGPDSLGCSGNSSSPLAPNPPPAGKASQIWSHLHHVALHTGETSDSNNDLWQVTTDGRRAAVTTQSPEAVQ